MTDAEIYVASGWCPGEDGYHGFMSGIEYAAQLARDQSECMIEILDGRPREAAENALLDFADELEGSNERTGSTD